MRPDERWWYGKLVDGRLLSQHSDWQQEVLRDDLYADYLETLRDQGVHQKASREDLGRLLAKMLPRNFPYERQRSTGTGGSEGAPPKRRRIWGFPSLVECRAYFDRQTRWTHRWFDADGDGDSDRDTGRGV